MSRRSPIAAATACSDRAGGKKTIVLSFCRGYCEQNESMNSRAVVGPLFIFQFAAKIGAITLPPRRQGLRLPGVFSPRGIRAKHHLRLKRGSSAQLDRRAPPPRPSRRRRLLSSRHAQSPRPLLRQSPSCPCRTEESRRRPSAHSR